MCKDEFLGYPDIRVFTKHCQNIKCESNFY